MSGIYIHIPFCAKACHYCDFHFSTNLSNKSTLTNAICEEIKLRKKEFSGVFNSIYFGGGTPSLLTLAELEKIMNQIFIYVDSSQIQEVTIEVNPEDITVELLRGYQKIGINRLSIGVQSLDDKILNWMNRNHSSEKAITAINKAQELGIENISVDFIYGVPNFPNRNISNELYQLLNNSPFHISCYHFTIEEKTYFGWLKKQEKLAELTDLKSEEEFKLITQTLEQKGYDHYEISNFSLSGKASKHNTNYWKRQQYVGLGPSAHSYNYPTRKWNISNNAAYIKQLQQGKLNQEQEKLSNIDHFNELIMLGLRTKEGVNIEEALSLIESNQQDKIKLKIQEFIDDKFLAKEGPVISLRKEKWLLSEYVSRELFILN